MKNRAFIIMLTMMYFAACSPKVQVIPPASEVSFVSRVNDDVVRLSATGYAKGIPAAQLEAEKNAFRTLLLRGIPGSPYRNPIVPTADQEKHREYLENFLSNYQYRSFMVSSTATGSSETTRFSDKDLSAESRKKPSKRSGYKMGRVSLSINIHTLKQKLVQDGIIRKFGF